MALSGVIIKPVPDEDFYIRYSTVCDAPSEWGTRADMLRSQSAERLGRADTTGTSSHSGEYGWDEESVWVREGFSSEDFPAGAWAANVRRKDLRKFCEAAQGRSHWDPNAVPLTWDMFD